MTAITGTSSAKTKPSRMRRTDWTGYLLISPYVIYMILFWFYPFIWGFIIAFQKLNILSPDRVFVGLDIYFRALTTWTTISER
jgi:multiple sugar transport system permease protein